MKMQYIFFATAYLLISVLLPAEELEWTIMSLWESRYVAEGRDELDEGGLVSSELGLSYEGFELGVWGAFADDEDYQQLDLTVAYSSQSEAISWLVGYTHLEFEPSTDDDDELFVELETEFPLELIAAAAVVYSFEADGSFLELSLARSFQLFEGTLSITPYGLVAFDFGYRTEDFDGVNHFQCGIECEYALTEQVALVAYAAHSFAQEDIEREGLGDLSWVGVGASFSF